MSDLKKIKEKLNSFRKTDTNILSEKLNSEINSQIDKIVSEVDEIEKLDSVKSEINNRIIKPVATLLEQKSRLQKVSLVASLASLALAIFTIWNTSYNQPKLFAANKQETIEELSNLRNEIPVIYYDEKLRYGLKDSQGRIIVKPRYQSIEPFGVGQFGTYYKVKFKNKFGLISNQGNYILPTIYHDLEYLLFDTHKFINAEGLKGLVNVLNDTIVQAQYDELRVGNGLIYEYEQENKTGLLDAKTGGKLTVPRFDKVYFFGQNIMSYFTIEKGVIVVYEVPEKRIRKTEFTGIGNWGAGFYINDENVKYQSVKRGKYHGVLSSKGETVIEGIYDTITNEKNQVFRTELNGDIKFYDAVSKRWKSHN